MHCWPLGQVPSRLQNLHGLAGEAVNKAPGSHLYSIDVLLYDAMRLRESGAVTERFW